MRFGSVRNGVRIRLEHGASEKKQPTCGPHSSATKGERKERLPQLWADWAAAMLLGRPTNASAGKGGSAGSAHNAEKMKQAGPGGFPGRQQQVSSSSSSSSFLFTCFQKYLKYILIQNKIKQIHTTQ
jgi:hypothetical protein